MTTDDPAWALGQHLCRTGYEDLPASAVASARRDILDTFGCMLGGSDSTGSVSRPRARARARIGGP
jgi:2-methylcitrate dehydratase PrpD